MVIKHKWSEDYVSKINPNEIKNKAKRKEVYLKQREVRRKLKRAERKKRKEEAKLLGPEEQERRKKQQRTLDNMRVPDVTLVDPDDCEVKGDEAIDEFSRYFSGDIKPKVIITTSYHLKYGKRTTVVSDDFIRDLLRVIPDSIYYQRGQFSVKQIVKECTTHGVTDIIIINEDHKKKKIQRLNALTLIHLPNGPTAFFKLGSITLHRDIPDGERASFDTEHRPEVMINNFTTRLGHRVGRMLAAIFHQEPNFKGRRVCVFHNQRDFIFFRQHRYIFDDPEKARLQEIGPKFTLKLKWLQSGIFNTKTGEYEWKFHMKMGKNRRRFFL